MKYSEIINQMTLEEKAAFMSGYDMWHIEGLERLSIPSIMATDGPHGLRKQNPEHASDVHKSVKSTCFPTASCLAATWNQDLIYRIGAAIGQEAQAEQIGVVLGPGANIKRTPTCGRNFEYFSEDPLLSGKMAAAWINGVQSEGIGASLKHFLANNQETRRMTISAEIDERALREIYLKSFEIAIKESHPKTVMCSYNRLNGEYCSENKSMLTDVLRSEWGFDGAVMSDWGATNDRVKGVIAGLELEMPSSGGINDKYVVAAVKEGILDEKVLDNAVNRVLELIYWIKEHAKENAKYDKNEHAKLSEQAAAEGAVLLKNEDDILPLKRTDDILFVGEMAKYPRYQGAGSSHIAPTKLVGILDALQNEGISFTYEPGYNINNGNRVNWLLVKKAVAKAKKYNKIVIATGLTDEYEAEGYDRQNMHMPKAHLALIKEILKVNKNVIILLANGSPVELPFKNDVKGILLSHLGGQNSGAAAVDLLFGKVNPSGKLAETYPVKLEDASSYKNIIGDYKTVNYAESIFVGYRYFSTAKKATAYPFGYGLSYTTFDYSALIVDNIFDKENKIKLSFDVKNTGSRRGAEIAQVYLTRCNKNIFIPEIELAAFCKVELEADETRKIELEITKDAFSSYIQSLGKFCVVGGEYIISVGKNSEQLLLTDKVDIGGEKFENLAKKREELNWYYAPTDNNPPEEQYEKLLGRKIENYFTPPKKGEFTVENTFEEMALTSMTVRVVLKVIRFVMKNFIMKCKKRDAGLKMMYETVRYSRIKNVSYSSQGMLSSEMAESLITIFNGHLFKGLKEFFAAMKKNKTESSGKIFLG